MPRHSFTILQRQRFTRAIQQNDIETVQTLLQQPSIKDAVKTLCHNSQPVVWLALESGHVACATALLKAGALLVHTDDDRRGQKKFFDVFYTLHDKQAELNLTTYLPMVKIILSHAKAKDLNYVENGISVLAILIGLKLFHLVKIALEQGAEPNQPRQRPFPLAVALTLPFNNAISYITLLCKHGANPHLKQSNELSPFELILTLASSTRCSASLIRAVFNPKRAQDITQLCNYLQTHDNPTVLAALDGLIPESAYPEIRLAAQTSPTVTGFIRSRAPSTVATAPISASVLQLRGQLDEAIRANDVTACQRLIVALQGDINYVDANFGNPLYTALDYLALDALALLLQERANIHLTPARYRFIQPLLYALAIAAPPALQQQSTNIDNIDTTFSKILLLLIQSGALNYNTACPSAATHETYSQALLQESLALAAVLGFDVTSGTLIENGATLYNPLPSGKTPRDCALAYCTMVAQKYHTDLQHLSSQTGPEAPRAIRLMTLFGGPPSLADTTPVTDAEGLTALHRAADNLDIETCRGELIANLRAVHAKAHNGYTPLHCAAEGKGGSAIVQLFVSHGADPHCRTDIGLTPLHLAAWCDDDVTCKFLLEECHVDVNAPFIPQHQGRRPLEIAVEHRHYVTAALLITHGAAVNTPTADGYYPLHRAAGYGDSAMCRLLLSEGHADATVKGALGETPADLARAMGHPSLAAELKAWPKPQASAPKVWSAKNAHPQFRAAPQPRPAAASQAQDSPRYSM